MEIRRGREDDLRAIYEADRLGVDQEKRRDFIRKLVRDASVHVALLHGTLVGYVALEHSFFGRGFISMLAVEPAHRRRGVGTALMRHVEGLCQSDRIFTSTNESNLPMQSLLRRLGYRHSGTVDDLDPGDPELFYSRRLR